MRSFANASAPWACTPSPTSSTTSSRAQGLGKTMNAKNIVHHAVLAGHSALFTTIDEIGYLEYEQRSADLLFQLVSRRYEHRTLVLTTNKSFSDWTRIFPGAACATALVDRVVHHVDVIHIEGKSYRLRESEEAQRAKPNKPPPKRRRRTPKKKS